MLHRHLLILQRFSGSLFGAPNGPNAFNVPGDFHPVTDSGVWEALAEKPCGWSQIELGNLASIATGPRYCVIVSRRWGSCEQVAVACETFEDTCLRRQVRLSSLKTRKTSPHRVDVRRPFCSTCQLQQAFACHGTIPQNANRVLEPRVRNNKV